MKRTFMLLLAIMVIPAMLFANGLTTEAGKPTVDVFDADISLATNQIYNMTNDNVYILKELVFVDSGCVLNIDSGTVIKGEPGIAENSKALICARGGQIFANGTRNYPIIMTGTVDNVDDPTDMDFCENYTWGGLLILGMATVNTTDGTNQIEGIDPQNPKGLYGSDTSPDVCDNSGVYRYISVRHGGTEIGEANEINGITFGGVGAGTTVEYCEVFNNYDDGYEWFGGDVNTKYLVSAFNGDDGFDYDEGFRGCHQYWLMIMSPVCGGDSGGEHDGGTSPEDGTPFAEPFVWNLTSIGAGIDQNQRGIRLRDNAGAHFLNSIFVEHYKDFVRVEDIEGPTNSPEDSRSRVEGDCRLTFEGNYFYKGGEANTIDDFSWEEKPDTYSPIDPQLGEIMMGNVAPGACATWRDNNLGIDPMIMYDNHAPNWTDPDLARTEHPDYWAPVVNCPPWPAWICGQPDIYVPPVIFNPMLSPESPAATAGITDVNCPNICAANPGNIDLVDYRGAFPPYDPGQPLEDQLWIAPWTYVWFLGMVWDPAFEQNNLCGDPNGDGSPDVSDAVYIINFAFAGGTPPDPLFTGDANCDQSVDVSDAVYIINYAFAGGNAPCDLDGDGYPDCNI